MDTKQSIAVLICDRVRFFMSRLLPLLEERQRGQTLLNLTKVTRSGGRLAATFVHGRGSGIRSKGWLPGRYFSPWTKSELNRVVSQGGWTVETIVTVTNQDRKGRWLNLLAHIRPERT